MNSNASLANASTAHQPAGSAIQAGLDSGFRKIQMGYFRRYAIMWRYALARRRGANGVSGVSRTV